MTTNNQTKNELELIEQLRKIVLDNFNNEQFGVNELSKEIGYSRSHLHRKLTTLRGLSISQFIREVRLEEALKLLRSEGLTASEVAYRVGFNNPSYFNTCFHEFYGFPPGEAKHRILKTSVKTNSKDKSGEGKNNDNTETLVFKAIPSNASKRKILVSRLIVVFILAVLVSVFIGLFLENKRINSVLVLPFENYTGQNELDYFVSGMHSLFIGDLGQISGLRVISETSSKAYKSSHISLKEMAKEANVNSVIEPSVFCIGDSICLQLKLISIYPKEEQIWVGNYREEKSKILIFYNQLTRQVAKEVKVKLTNEEEMLLSESLPVDTAALHAYMEGLDNLDKISVNSLIKAEECFRTAREKAPDWGLPYGGLAQVWVYRMQMGFSTPSNAIPKIYTHLNTALEIDPNSANSHYIKAGIAVWTEWDWEKGEKEFLKAIELNPNHALSRIFYAHFLMIQHRNEEALEQANYALELDPLEPFILAMYAKVLMNNGEFEIAKEFVEKAILIDPNHHMATNALQQFCKVTGDYERWFKVLKKRSKWRNAETLALIENIFNEKGYLATIEEIIKMNEEVEKKGSRISYHGQAMDYLQLKNYKKAIYYLYKAYDENNPNLPYASTRRYDSHILKDYPAYVELMKKMRLPIEK